MDSNEITHALYGSVPYQHVLKTFNKQQLLEVLDQLLSDLKFVSMSGGHVYDMIARSMGTTGAELKKEKIRDIENRIAFVKELLERDEGDNSEKH